MKPARLTLLIAGTLLCAPVLADDHDESIDGDLSDNPAAPTVLTLTTGTNTVTGSVENSNDPGGDRDFITFTVPNARTLTAINLAGWSPDDLGFMAINDGATGFIPSGGTIGDFLAGSHIDASLIGTDLLETFQDASVTTNSLPQPSLGPGTYTLVIQQTGPMLQDYSIELELVETDRQVQVQSIDFVAGVIELHNFAEVDVDLTGWRFCTHDFDQVRQYTAAGGLNGVVIEAGTSVFIHINNDAPADPDRINRSVLGGGFASPLDQDAFGMQLFFPFSNGAVSFGTSSLIADHIQWNIDGGSVGNAAFRTGQAVGEGLWSANNDFIATQADSQRIDLTDLSGDQAGSPSEYAVTNPALCVGDIADDFGSLGADGMVSFGDFLALLGLVGPCPGGTPGCTGDIADDFGTIGGDGMVSFGDFLALLGLVGPCP